jgi:hypothetical protein
MTELIWEGKYAEDKTTGRRVKVSPPRIALPFQTMETVNESAVDRLNTLDLFASGRETEWRNRLIWGDKKYVVPSLLPEFAGKVDLIYIDPPFDTGANFSYTVTIPATRIRKNQDLQQTVSWPYETPGSYRVVVKVIDILGERYGEDCGGDGGVNGMPPTLDGRSPRMQFITSGPRPKRGSCRKRALSSLSWSRCKCHESSN